MFFLTFLRGSVIEVPVLTCWVRDLITVLGGRVIDISLSAVESTSVSVFLRNITIEALTLIFCIYKHIHATLRHNYNQVANLAVFIVPVSWRAGHHDLIAIVGS